MYTYILNGEHYVNPSTVESGYVRVDGQVVSTAELNLDERNRYNLDRYYFIGTWWSNSIIPQNDKFLDKFQEIEADMGKIQELHLEIIKNRHRDITMRL